MIAKLLFLAVAAPAFLHAASADSRRPAPRTAPASMKQAAWDLLAAAQQDNSVTFAARITTGATYADKRDGHSGSGPLTPGVLQPFLRDCALFNRGVKDRSGWRLTWQCGVGDYVGTFLNFRGGHVYRVNIENIPLVTSGVPEMYPERFPETVDGD
jgi:hypothetical protein